MKKILVFLCLLSVLAMIFVSCGGNNSDDTEMSNPDTSTPPSVDTAQGSDTTDSSQGSDTTDSTHDSETTDNTQGSDTTDNTQGSDTTDSSQGSDTTDDTQGSDKPPVDDKKQITDVIFSSALFYYDGSEKELTISGILPSGAVVSYENNKATDAGTYTAKAVITCEGYETLTLTATLTIKKIDFNNNLGNASFDYDGNKHTITISGNLPAGTSVAYTGGEDGANGATNAGTYTIKATLTNKNYNDLTLTATLTINKANFGNTLANASFDYNGGKHTITISGSIPEGTTVTYTGGEDGKNGATNAGAYTIKATLTNKNYNDLTLTATLTINKIDYNYQATLSDAKFEYDGKSHSITITASNLPADATVTYTGGENGKNAATNVGTYTITATITHKNYKTVTLTATITITTKEQSLSVAFIGGRVFFQNTLDKKYLYSYASGSLSYISRDMPTCMVTVGSKMYFLSSGLLSSGIYSFDFSKNKSECLFEVSADNMITDGTYIYYSVNSLLKSENNGIYKIKISDLENSNIDPTPTRLTSAKAGDMTVVGGYIYFANKSDGSKLYAISTSANNANPVKIYDYKISDIINDGTKIYFTRDITLSNLSTGAAIYSINVSGGLYSEVNDDSSKVIKITMSKGKNLTIIGDYVYFVNTDMVTSTIFGDGIYRAKKDGSGWVNDSLAQLSGASKVVDGENDKIYGLASDGTYLYYYRANTQHLYRYSISSQTENDLMQGFVPPEYNEPITTYYEKAQEYKGDIYYINMKDGGKLYRYSPQTGMDVRITNLAVADFAINDGVLYYCTVRFLVNFDLYRMSLTDGEPERISTEKCMNFSFCDGKLFYTNYSSKNTLNCMDLVTLEDTVIFDTKSVSAGATFVHDGYVYFVASDQLYRYSLTTNTAELVNKDLKPLEYLIYDGKILMMNTAGLTNHVSIYDIAENKIYDIDSLGVSGVSNDVRGMFVYNGEMYYYRNVAAGTNKAGLYKVVYKNGTYSAELIDKFEGHYLCNSVLIGDKLYFMDVWQVKDSIPTPSSSGKLCVLDLKTLEITELN